MRILQVAFLLLYTGIFSVTFILYRISVMYGGVCVICFCVYVINNFRKRIDLCKVSFANVCNIMSRILVITLRLLYFWFSLCFSMSLV